MNSKNKKQQKIKNNKKKHTTIKKTYEKNNFMYRDCPNNNFMVLQQRRKYWRETVAVDLSKHNGNFWEGAAMGLTVSGLNHFVHRMDGEGDSDPPKKESTKDFVKRYLAGQKKDFFGADVDLWSYNGTSNSTLFGTIHTSEVHFYNYLNKGFQIQSNGLLHPSTMLLMHEYGHFLHAQYATTNFYSYAMWSSAATANFSWAGTNWTEITANTYSYYYFGQPNGWNFVEYPVNSNYLSPKTIQSLQNHK